MKIAEGIEMLRLPAIMMAGADTINPTLIWDENAMMLIDTGLPGQLPALCRAINEAGLDLEQLTHIVMTHHDIDHIGNLAALLKMLPHQVMVMCHELEKPYIQGDFPPIKIAARTTSPMEQKQLAHLTDKQRQAVLDVFSNFSRYTVPVNATLADGERLPILGGITVIHTPGHTPGHLCLYHPSSQTLIAGDTFFVEDGALTRAPSFVNHDNQAALASMRKLLPFRSKNIVCYHGGLYIDQDGVKVHELAQF
jgi:glyoxylase-like metal-dependent hydrolase (beta-lactamase superfamily II)